MNSKVTLQNKQLEEQIAWMRNQTTYSKLSTHDIQEQNKKVLATLKHIEARLDKQLQQQQYSRISLPSQGQNTDQLKIVLQNIKSNQITIKVLQKEVKKARDRNEELKNGYQSKINTRKYQLQKKISEYKAELRKLKLQQNEINKRLATRQNPIEPQFLNQHIRLQEELRVWTLKYMKIVQKYNRVSEQLAVTTSSVEPDIHIPEEIYDKELEEKQEAQFKEYQGIVKMCTILSKRNDSQTNKYNRLYTQKLKDLQKIIINLGQVDRLISLREGEIIEGKKNLDILKQKAESKQGVDYAMLSISHSQLRRASYSTSRLTLEKNKQRENQFTQGKTSSRKLSKMV